MKAPAPRRPGSSPRRSCRRFLTRARSAQASQLHVKLQGKNTIYNIIDHPKQNLLFYPHFESIIKSPTNDHIKPNDKFNINLTNKKVIQLYNDLYKYNKNIHYDSNDKYINLLLTQFEKVSPRYTNNMLFKCVRNINKLLNKINNKDLLLELDQNIQFYTSTEYVQLITKSCLKLNK